MSAFASYIHASPCLKCQCLPCFHMQNLCITYTTHLLQLHMPSSSLLDSTAHDLLVFMPFSLLNHCPLHKHSTLSSHTLIQHISASPQHYIENSHTHNFSLLLHHYTSISLPSSDTSHADSTLSITIFYRILPLQISFPLRPHHISLSTELPQLHC